MNKKYEKKLTVSANKIGAEYRCVVDRIAKDGKHFKVHMAFEGKTMYLTVGKTPSDHRAWKNHLTTVKHTCWKLSGLTQ